MSRREVTQLTPEQETDLGFLGGVLDPVKKAQEQLEGYINRIEKASNDCEKLEAKRDSKSKELSDIDNKLEREEARILRELRPLQDKLQATKDALVHEEEVFASEKIKLDKILSDHKNKVEKDMGDETARHQEMLKNHVVEIGNANKQKSEWEEANALLIKENEKLVKEKESNEKKLNDSIEKFNLKISELKTELETKTIELDEKTKSVNVYKKEKEQLEKDIIDLKKNKEIKKVELEKYSEEENKKIDNELATKKGRLVLVEKELEALEPKLAAIKQEFSETQKIIVAFSNKQEELARREKILKKKYEDAGFPF